MDAQQLLTFLVSAVLSVGFGAAITTAITSRSAAKKIQVEAKALEQKTPGEIDSIAVQGAERAVLMLQATNQTLVSENERLFRENTRLHAVIAELEVKVETYRQSMEAAENALATARREYEVLHAAFDELRTSVANGG